LEEFLLNRTIDYEIFFALDKQFLKSIFKDEIKHYVDNGLSFIAKDNITGKIIGTLFAKDLYG
jgi:hypothetical protein